MLPPHGNAGTPLLLALAARFDSREPSVGGGWIYRRDIGAWVDADEPDALMVNTPPKPSAPPKPPAPPIRPRPRPESKKFDVETGEDMKGA